MTVHIFRTYTYCDQRWYMQRYLRKPYEMKVRILTEYPGQLVTSLPGDNMKEVFYRAIKNSWNKKMAEQVYNYLDGPVQSMA